jgi:hypothetical protein
MKLTVVIILCIFVILIMWIIQYRPQKDDVKEGFKFNLNKIKNSIVSQVNNLKKTKGASIINLLPPAIAAKLSTVIAAANKQKKEKEKKEKEKKDKEQAERERKENEEKQRLKREEENKKRYEAATKIIDKLMNLVPKYPDSKYDMKTIINSEEMDNFINGKKIVDALRTYVNGPFTDNKQIILLVQMLRESMALSK